GWVFFFCFDVAATYIYILQMIIAGICKKKEEWKIFCAMNFFFSFFVFFLFFYSKNDVADDTSAKLTASLPRRTI
ncbi:hypothetical protein Q8G40_29555, partial [Klebsiella pneumoniae]|uniref:hypothetical protein n=1 Tax=Klebsiella pneumoniae TaxID=573 RepID=UPI0030139321